MSPGAGRGERAAAPLRLTGSGRRRVRAWLLVGSAAALVGAVVRVAIVPVVVTPLFDRVLALQELGALAPLLAIGGALALTGAILLWTQDAAFGRAAAAASASWRADLGASLVRRPPGTLPGSSGGLSARLLSDLREVEVFVLYGLGSAVAESVTLLCVLAVLAWTDPLATGALLLLALPAIVALRLVGRRIEAASERHQAGLERVGARLQEAFRHHETVRTYAADAFMAERLARENRATERAMARRTALAALQVPVSQVLLFTALAALIALLVQRAAAGVISTGQVVTFVTLVALLATPAQLLPRAVAMAQQARAAWRRLASLGQPDTAPSLAPAERDEATTAPHPSLALVDLRLRVPGGPEVLRGATLTLPAPALVAIVGPSGVGKTTLLRALLGFVPIEQGQVLLCGEPIGVDEPRVRRLVAAVAQGTDLLSGRVRDNLSLGRTVAEARLWRSLDQVGMRATIEALPAQLDTDLGEDGGGLSGGQRQRLAIARALLGQPAVLLLDEPTSALDEASEREVVGVLRQQAQQRLVLAVSHRPALVSLADRVLRLEHGTIGDVTAATRRSVDASGDASGAASGDASEDASSGSAARSEATA